MGNFFFIFKNLYLKLLIFQTLDLDDFSNSFCSQGKYPLINGVKLYLNNQSLTSYATTKGSTATLPSCPTLASTTATKTTESTKTTTVTTTTSTKTSTKTSTTNPTNLCFNGDGYYPDLSSGCQKFYICFLGATRIEYQYCPSGTLFDKITGACNWEYLVKCS